MDWIEKVRSGYYDHLYGVIFDRYGGSWQYTDAVQQRLRYCRLCDVGERCWQGDACWNCGMPMLSVKPSQQMTSQNPGATVEVYAPWILTSDHFSERTETPS